MRLDSLRLRWIETSEAPALHIAIDCILG